MDHLLFCQLLQTLGIASQENSISRIMHFIFYRHQLWNSDLNQINLVINYSINKTKLEAITTR